MKAALPVSVALALAVLAPLEAFPPAPHHMLHGVVKNEQGTPLSTGEATLILDGPAGEVMRGPIDAGLVPGLNYRLFVAQVSGRSAQLYAATAMLPSSPFSIRVEIGNVHYLPIQMQGDLHALGESGGATRLDLTLGVDSDRDGLPDAWEQNVIDFDPFDGIASLADVNPGDDLDGDGMKNHAEYIAGTYAFDHVDALRLEVREVVNGIARLEFVAITGRTYRLFKSARGDDWGVQPFSLQSSGEGLKDHHRAESVTLLHAFVPVGSDPSALFQLHVE